MINNISCCTSVVRAEVWCRDEEADRAAAIRTHVGRVRRQPAAQIRGQRAGKARDQGAIEAGRRGLTGR